MQKRPQPSAVVSWTPGNTHAVYACAFRKGVLVSINGYIYDGNHWRGPQLWLYRVLGYFTDSMNNMFSAYEIMNHLNKLYMPV